MRGSHGQFKETPVTIDARAQIYSTASSRNEHKRWSLMETKSISSIAKPELMQCGSSFTVTVATM